MLYIEKHFYYHNFPEVGEEDLCMSFITWYGGIFFLDYVRF